MVLGLLCESSSRVMGIKMLGIYWDSSVFSIKFFEKSHTWDHSGFSKSYTLGQQPRWCKVTDLAQRVEACCPRRRVWLASVGSSCGLVMLDHFAICPCGS